MTKLTLEVLKECCRANKFRGFSKLNKIQLINVILQHEVEWNIVSDTISELEKSLIQTTYEYILHNTKTTRQVKTLKMMKWIFGEVRNIVMCGINPINYTICTDDEFYNCENFNICNTILSEIINGCVNSISSCKTIETLNKFKLILGDLFEKFMTEQM
jgi:hypothetical protein